MKPHLAQPCHQWNSHPGQALAIPPSLPLPSIVNTSALLAPIQSATSFSSFTAIITASANLTITSSSPIFRLIKAVAGSSKVEAILVLWGSQTLKPPPLKDWARLGGFPSSTPLKILSPTIPVSNISKRFQAVSEAPTEAVLCLDDDAVLTTSEVWSSNSHHFHLLLLYSPSYFFHRWILLLRFGKNLQIGLLDFLQDLIIGTTQSIGELLQWHFSQSSLFDIFSGGSTQANWAIATPWCLLGGCQTRIFTMRGACRELYLPFFAMRPSSTESFMNQLNHSSTLNLFLKSFI